jgi:hypothetical protein
MISGRRGGLIPGVNSVGYLSSLRGYRNRQSSGVASHVHDRQRRGRESGRVVRREQDVRVLE